MQTIMLEPPRYFHLANNTEPTFAELDQTLAQLSEARAGWTPEHDTRPRIAVLAKRVAELASDLEAIDDQDRELQTIEQLRLEYCTRLAGQLVTVRRFSAQIATEEEGVRPLQKRLLRALSDAAVYTRAYESGTESRAQITAAYQAAKQCILDIQTVDERLDRWAPNMAIEACDKALHQLAQPPRTTPEPEPEPRVFNHLRQKISDAIDVLRVHLGAVSLPGADEGRQEREAVLQAVNSLRNFVSADLFSPLDDLHVQEIWTRIAQIRRDLHALPNVAAIKITPLHHIIGNALASYDLHLDKIKALLPCASNPQPKGLLSRIAENFGWDTDEPEIA